MRPREGGRGGHVAPRSDEQSLRALEGLEGPEGVVAVAVRPAGDDHGRARDAPVVGPQRPVSPVRGVDLLLDPAQEPRLGALDPIEPLVAPALAEHGRHRREHVHRGHVQDVVDEVDAPERSARVVDVVRVAVVRRVDRTDRAQRRRLLHGQLDRVEARVGRPVHADAAVAPVLRGEPGDDLREIRLLLRRVLVGGEPLGGARAAEVDAGDGEPALVAQALVLARVRRGQVVHPVRAAPPARTAAGRASGSHSRAASRTPSASGIQARRCSTAPILRTVGSALGGPALERRATRAARGGGRVRDGASSAARGRPRVAPAGDALRRRLARGHARARRGGLDRA